MIRPPLESGGPSGGLLNTEFLFSWLKAFRWQRLPEVERLDDLLVKHFEGTAAYGDHHVRFGVVESLNTTIKGVMGRARRMRVETIVLLKLKWATARPIRSSRDLARFIELICVTWWCIQIDRDRQTLMRGRMHGYGIAGARRDSTGAPASTRSPGTDGNS
jgi:hypothetical protein